MTISRSDSRIDIIGQNGNDGLHYRAPEADDRQPEPVTPAVIKKLWRAIDAAEQRELAKYGPDGANTLTGRPHGTEYVQVRAATLRELLLRYEEAATPC